MLVGPEKATTTVSAIMTLHNFVRRDYVLCGNQDDHRIFEVEHQSDSWLDLPPMSIGKNHSQDAKRNSKRVH